MTFFRLPKLDKFPRLFPLELRRTTRSRVIAYLAKSTLEGSSALFGNELMFGLSSIVKVVGALHVTAQGSHDSTRLDMRAGDETAGVVVYALDNGVSFYRHTHRLSDRKLGRDFRNDILQVLCRLLRKGESSSPRWM